MKFIIPQRKDLTREVIKEEFFKKYYPEMKVRQGWWYIYGRYVLLQKNPFVCAKFTVKQKDDEGKTHIRIEKDQNKWAYLIGAPIINTFIQGDFYDELYRNFGDWLTKKYTLSKDEIILTEPMARTNLHLNSIFIAAIIVGALLFIFDQMDLYSYHDNLSLWERFLNCIPTGRRSSDLPKILLMFGVAYYFIHRYRNRKAKEKIEKKERMFGLKIQTYKSKNKYLNFILSVIKCICLYFVLYIMVGYIPNLIDNMRPRDFVEKEIPAAVYDLAAKEIKNPEYYSNIEYLTPDIILFIHDGKEDFYGLDGKPAHNLTVWAFENKDSYGSFAIIAAILFAVILYFWRKRKGDEDKTSVSPDETIRYERTEDSDTTLKL